MFSHNTSRPQTVTSSRCPLLMPLWLVLTCALWGQGCRDFDAFDCFRNQQGCSNEQVEIRPDQDSPTPPLRPDRSPSLVMDRSLNQMDQAELGTLNQETPDQEVNLDEGSLERLDQGDLATVDSELDLDPIDMSPPSQCEGNTALHLMPDGGLGSVIHWTCIPDYEDQELQIMTAEMSVIQAQRVWRELLGLCDDTEPMEPTKLCATLDRFRASGYVNDIQDERRRRYLAMWSEMQTLRMLAHTPISDLSPDEINLFISQLNLWARETQHRYTYRLPCHQLWGDLRGLVSDTSVYKCDSDTGIRAVFKGETGLRGGSDVGCRLKRPRSAFVQRGQTRCFDVVWAGQTNEAERASIPANHSEDRYYTEDVKLCDFHGNLREVLTECPDSPFCTWGGSWKNQPNDDGYNKINSLSADSNNEEVGFRLIRYPADTSPPPCMISPQPPTEE